jgi:hypothetical protein
MFHSLQDSRAYGTTAYFFGTYTNLHWNLLLWVQQFEPYGALAVQWVVFGSSGHEERPAGGVLANYWKCLSRENGGPMKLVKLVANTKWAAHPWKDPHTFT